MGKVVAKEKTPEGRPVYRYTYYKAGIRKIPGEQKIVDRVVELMGEGKSDEQIIMHLKDEFNKGKPKAEKYIKAAVEYMFPDGVQEQRDEILAKNAKYLMSIIAIGFHDHRYLKEANAAIRELNKMVGVGNGTTIAVQTDNENNTQQVVIKFDQ